MARAYKCPPLDLLSLSIGEFLANAKIYNAGVEFRRAGMKKALRKPKTDKTATILALEYGD